MERTGQLWQAAQALKARLEESHAAYLQVLRRSGQVLTVGELAREYDFTDTDGCQPPPFRLPAG